LGSKLRKASPPAPLTLLLIGFLECHEVELRRYSERRALVIVSTTPAAWRPTSRPARPASPAERAGIFGSQLFIHLLDLGDLLVGQLKFLFDRVNTQQRHPALEPAKHAAATSARRSAATPTPLAL